MTLTSEHSSLTNEVIELRDSLKCASEKNSALLKDLEGTKEQLFRPNMGRKKLHNVFMELSDNILVFCRVRPPLECEEDRVLFGWNYINEATLEIFNLETLASGVKNKSLQP